MEFTELTKINVNDHIEQRDGLSYLTWSWAWDTFKKNMPDATYSVWKNENGLPYAYDENTGYMVFTSITAGGQTHEMWLPVMDSTNNALKSQPYIRKTKYKEIEIKAATMFDINKTIMRCLVKNMAMFGLGLYIYAGEDLPTPEGEIHGKKEVKAETEMDACRKFIEQMMEGDLERIQRFLDSNLGDRSKPYKDLTLEQLRWLKVEVVKAVGEKV